tara:strand:+ start:2257 stop:3618 length:1362 start_codon:yes stop_codon:yes gene_type:complete
MLIINRLSSLLSKGLTRNSKIKLSLIGLSFIKPLSFLTGALLVPVLLGYLGTVKYGIWLTVYSMIGWTVLFDFGLGNGLRNNLGEALAKNDFVLGRILVSTTLIMLCLFACIIYAVFLLTMPFINWIVILNAPESLEQELKIFIMVIFSFFILRIMTGVIITILFSDQRPALGESINTLADALILVLIYIVTLYTENSLIYVGLVSSSLTAIVPFFVSIILFRHAYSRISPALRYFSSKYVTKLGGQGLQFFVMQISAIIIFSTDNIIITQLFGPAEVVPYNVAHKLFGYMIVVFGIVLTPFWGAYNEAYHQNDLTWLINTLKKMLIVWAIIIVVLFALLSVSDKVYNLWVGDQVVIPRSMSFCMAIFVFMQTFNMIFVTFIFSTGKIRIQTYAALFGAAINLPLSYFFAKILGFGPSGVILATAACGSFNLILAPVQCYKLAHKRAEGIWAQ